MGASNCPRSRFLHFNLNGCFQGKKVGGGGDPQQEKTTAGEHLQIGSFVSWWKKHPPQKTHTTPQTIPPIPQ